MSFCGNKPLREKCEYVSVSKKERHRWTTVMGKDEEAKRQRLSVYCGVVTGEACSSVMLDRALSR